MRNSLTTEKIFFHPSSSSQTLPLVLIAFGAIAAGYGLYSDAVRTWPVLLLNSFYVISLAISALFFLAVQRLSGARWSASLRRIPEALLAPMPVAAVLMLVLFFGRHQLFAWTDPKIFTNAPEIAGKVQYLREPFVFSRWIVSLLLWVIFAWLFRKLSLEQDKHPGQNLIYHQRLSRLSPAFVLVFALTFTLVSFDFVISLDPRWFSTIFAIYIFAGTFVQGIAAITLAAVLLKESGISRDWFTEHQLHDLGKLLFAFSTFWAYIWVSQYLLIWYGDIPEEVIHYIPRTNGPWLYVFLLNLIVNWIVPFLALLSATSKRDGKVLKFIAIWLLIGHWLDLFVQIIPAFSNTPRFGLLEILITAGYVALFYFLAVRSLATAPLVPLNDPILAAERQHEELAHAVSLSLNDMEKEFDAT